MRTYIPLAEIEARDPAWAERIRVRDREKQRRLRAANPERARELGRDKYANNPEHFRAKRRTWHAANPEKDRQMKLNYREQSRAKYIVQAVRSAANRKAVRFDISLEWVQARLDAGTCELSGLPFNFDESRKSLKDFPSVDRIIPGGDYIESNCRLILFGLNSLLGRSGNAGVPRAVTRIHELRGFAGP